MEGRARPRQALAPSRPESKPRGGRSRAFAFAFAFAFTGASAFAQERGAHGCAGDGAPPGSAWPRRSLSLTGLVSGQALIRSGQDLNVYLGDPVDGSGLQARLVRVGLCGVVAVPLGTISYALVYEPWSQLESRRVDADAWGRFTVAEFGWQPLRWLSVYAGIRKVLFDFAGDTPEQGRELPILPSVTRGVAPDRRLGLTLDLDFGALRLVAGGYQSTRRLADLADGGILVAARALVEPIGPVGATLSTEGDAPFWRRRARIGLDLGILYEWTPQGTGIAFEGDAPFKWGPLALVVEYLYASGLSVQEPSLPPMPRGARQGLYAQAALMALRPWIELEAGYEWQSRSITEEPRGTFHALTFGLTVYGWRTFVKVQMAYSRRFHYAGVGADDEVGLLVLTLAK